MTGWPSAAALLAVVAAMPVVPPAQAGDGGAVPSRVLSAFQGDDVFESSGLVDAGELLFTMNDSGDDAVVYGVDARTGRTVSRTTYADEVTDVEGLAPGADGSVWAGDIGDNKEDRDDVAVYRVRPDDGEQTAPRFELTYPDGPHDAETLLVHPRTQQVFVVSKTAFGGTVYAAPRDLREDAPNPLRVFAHVDGLLSDGAFFPDGRHVILRTYGTATVYTFPGFEKVGTVPLPKQEQGEGIAVGADGRVLLSSEGTGAPVLQVDLPAALGAAGSGTPSRAPAASPTASPSESPGRSDARPATGSRRLRDWGGIAVVTVAIGAVGWLTVRGSRVRGR